MKDRKENDNEFFIEVDLPFLVNRVKIEGRISFNGGGGARDSLVPVYFIEPGVDVLQYKSEERFVFLIEPEQRKNNIKHGVAFLLSAMAFRFNLFGVNYLALNVGVFENDNGTMDPNSKFVKEFTYIIVDVGFVDVDDFVRVISLEGFAVFINDYLRQNENDIMNFRIVVVSDIAHGDFTLNVLKGEKAVKNFLEFVCDLVRIIFNQ